MARVLIGWELGAGRGHLVSMRLMADELLARGHQVVLAAQRIDVPVAMPSGAQLLQAPLWPGLLTAVQAGEGRVATIVDVLARLGLGRQGVLAGMVRAWEALLSVTDADVVVADYAPALLTTVRGRWPSVATGPGFQVPPADIDPVPRLGGGEPGHDEAALLDTIDAELHQCGLAPLPHLAALFATDAPLIASVPELDPYRRDDTTARFIAPGLDGVPQPGGGEGDEVFVYANSPLQASEAFWRALAATGLPIRAHIPGIDTALRASIATLGVRVEPRPVPIDRIAARSRLCVNHGAHGILCAMLAGGVAQVMLPMDLEKQLHSVAVARHGYGIASSGATETMSALTQTVRTAYDDTAMHRRVRDAAPSFHARMAEPYGRSVADAVEALL